MFATEHKPWFLKAFDSVNHSRLLKFYVLSIKYGTHIIMQKPKSFFFGSDLFDGFSTLRFLIKVSQITAYEIMKRKLF